MTEMSDIELLEALGVDTRPKNKIKRTAREERIIAGFEEIQRFVEEHGRLPVHGEDRDIFERIYAVRLDQIYALEECRSLLTEYDHQGLLDVNVEIETSKANELSDDELLSALGVDKPRDQDVTNLRHVKPRADVRAAEDIARRDRCEDFDKFKPLFETLQSDLESGKRQTRKFESKAEIRPGSFFVVGGQVAYVAEMGEVYSNAQGRRDARLRVVFDNGTESNLLMRSLQRALHKDEAGRRITEPTAGPLFASVVSEEDTESGIIYVLRSKSSLPEIVNNYEIIHKIGVTKAKIEARLANASHDPTFLMADVEVVAQYELYNINRVKLENLLHRFFAHARLDIEITDRFGKATKPREWFLVPLSVIDEVVEKIQKGTITDYLYDPSEAKLKSVTPQQTS